MSAQFRDYTGVDSLTAFVASIAMFLLVQFLERNGPIFRMRGQKPYIKVIEEKEVTDDLKNSDDTKTMDPSTSITQGRDFFEENLDK